MNKNEAPNGFIAVLKSESTAPNICCICDARPLCVQNKDNSCLKNRCMAYEMIGNDGKTYRRADGASVFFKKIWK